MGALCMEAWCPCLWQRVRSFMERVLKGNRGRWEGVLPRLKLLTARPPESLFHNKTT